jgi:hypothetical protein
MPPRQFQIGKFRLHAPELSIVGYLSSIAETPLVTEKSVVSPVVSFKVMPQLSISTGCHGRNMPIAPSFEDSLQHSPNSYFGFNLPP